MAVTQKPLRAFCYPLLKTNGLTMLAKLANSALLLIATTSATLACDYPTKVEIPDGNTATRDAMLQGQRQIKQYVADMEAYLQCIVDVEKVARAEMVDLDPEDEQQREDMLNKKYNAAVSEMEMVAANFNSEVQTFRSRDE